MNEARRWPDPSFWPGQIVQDLLTRRATQAGGTVSRENVQGPQAVQRGNSRLRSPMKGP